ncbi:Asparagine synthetase [glutamine-hydrolyzing] 1 [bacterium HR39]|nr:Asparagine synthetase [glutamine-hydrolyzing] 1 [bacterium HR39]
MCGFAGFFLFDDPPGREAALRLVRTMARTLAHRGPDEEGVFAEEDGHFALGFRRLAVIDPSPAGSQPMVSACGRFVLAFNGEIYDHAELRAELAAAGHVFRGHSDTEALLETLARHGPEEGLARASGMFALALWDRRERRLVLARDRFGKKPLYSARLGDALVFASELRALLRHPLLRPARDPEALALYLRFGYVPGPRTILDGVRRLEPGHLLVAEADGSFRLHRWFDLVAEVRRARAEPLDPRSGEATEALHALLLDATRRRLVADVPVGLFLSGGIDSSLVAACAAGAGAELPAFTIAFAHAAHDESAHAARVAKALGLCHHVRPCGERELLELVADLPEVFDEPFADASALPTLLLCRFARGRVVVALSGDGGDELFGGYTRYADTLRLHRRLRYLPRRVRRLAAGTLSLLDTDLLRALGERLPALARLKPDERARKLREVLGASPEWLMRAIVSHHHDPRALYRLGREPEDPRWAGELGGIVPDLPAWLQLLDQLQWLPDDILVKVDRTSMSCGLEVRSPLLDERIVLLSWRLAPDAGGTPGAKEPLRRVLFRLLPAELFARPKQGFSPPVHTWLRGPLRDLCEELFAPASLREAGPFDPARVRRLWREHLEGWVDRRFELWNLLCYVLWYRRWCRAARAPEEMAA